MIEVTAKISTFEDRAWGPAEDVLHIRVEVNGRVFYHQGVLYSNTDESDFDLLFDVARKRLLRCIQRGLP
jgi:hypothetical protein